MNNGIYRLVFNASRGLWMAVSEHVKSHQTGKSNSGRSARRNHSKGIQDSAVEQDGASLFLILLGLGVMGVVDIAFAGALLPVGTLPVGLQAGVVNGSIVVHTPIVNVVKTDGFVLNVDQSSLKAIVGAGVPSTNDVRFNVGGSSVVNWNHMGGPGSATLIRIGGSDPTIVEGTLNSPNGAIYLINQNGILFANGAQINVNGLVASALDIKDSDFTSDHGSLNAYEDGKRAAYIWGGDAAGFKTVVVQVEPDARIKAALGSSVMLFAPRIIHQGSIETTEGQVVMAAGEKVYLSYAPELNGGSAIGTYNYSPDSPYRGLAGVLVEVDAYKKKITDSVDVPDEITGQVTNDTMGRILAQRGNVTMASFLVNQNGRVTATSSAIQKGSIRLLARDTISAENDVVFVEKSDGTKTVLLSNRLSDNGTTDSNRLITSTRTGKLNVGANSITAVLAEDSAAVSKTKEVFAVPQVGEPLPKVGEKSYLDAILSAVNVTGATITEDQVFNAPTVEAVGRQVTVGDNAKIVVPGGYISLSAQKSGSGFNFGNTNLLDSEARLYLGKNTLIDAAGLQNVAVNMDRNFIESLLTLTDLKDDPLNRDGFLYRKNVWFDIRNLPDSKVAELAGFVKQVPRSLGEKLATSGTVKLQSEGDLVQSSGSKVDVSGGSLNFNTGINKETWIIAANGKSYAFGDAPVDTIFTGFLGGSNSLLRQEASYTEGKAAGKVNVTAYNVALDGQLSGGAIYGKYQRESANMGGTLAINVMTTSAGFSHDVNVGSTTLLDSNFTIADDLPISRINSVEIDAAMLNRSGFEDVEVGTTGNVKVNAAIILAQGSKLVLSGHDVEVNKNIVARGGSIELKSNFNEVADVTNITVADGVKLDASGNWVNDTLNTPATGRVLTNGGKVTINSAGEVMLGTASLVDVSGGGWLQRDRKLVNGNAGNVSIASQVGQTGEDAAKAFTYKAPLLNGELRGFALGTGGNLSITAPFVTVGSSGFGDAREFLATPEFFQNSGFTGFSLTGRDGVLVRSNTSIDVIAKNYLLNKDYSQRVTGAHVNDFATPTVLPDYMSNSTSLALSSMSALDNNVSQAFVASGVSRGSVVVETDASLKVDANGVRKDAGGKSVPPSIGLLAWDNQLYVDGTLQALGGDITLTMNGDAAKKDNGYNAAQAIWLGANSKLLAAGYTRTTPSSNGLRAGVVYDGGNIIMDAKKGYVVAEAGSVIDVSGTSAVFDVNNINRFTPTNVASNGGDISIRAREGMLLDSIFKAVSPGALAGSLELRLTRGGSTGLGLESSPYPGSAESLKTGNPGNSPDQLWYVDLSQSGTFVPTSLDVGDSIQTAAGGLAKISANNIMSAGFSEVALKSEYGVRFSGDVDLKAARSLSFNAKVIEATTGSQVKLTAPNIVMSNIEDTIVYSTEDSRNIRPNTQFVAVTPVLGTANLVVNTSLLDLNGRFALSGFASSTLNSTNDVRLTGISDPNVPSGGSSLPPTGQLLTTGELNFNARQIYPTTFSDYTITVNGVGSKVSFNGTGSYDKVLSAAGQLTVNAETINQNGVLLAPFGSITLNASQTLNLNTDSVTSVSAQGALIPFGYTDQDGKNYLYDFGANFQKFTTPPERVVKLTAPNVNQAAESIVDISGGGDLLAYEWVPGIGGSSDVLASDANQNAFGKGTAATWAIMPANNQTFASYDTQYWQGSNVKAGDAVYISGMPGLTAGYYTLLPARYALLPDAMLVSAVAGYQDKIAGQPQTLANGSTLVSGHLAAYTSNGYTQTSRTGGFVVRPGSDAYKLAQYNKTTAGTYFKDNAQAQKTADAGRFSISATDNLVLKGILKALPGQGGTGAEVDIAAPSLLVVSAGEATGQVTKDGVTYLAIDESTLANFNAASLLLGGTRSEGQVDIISTEVRMSANTKLVGPEVILAATDTVRLEHGVNLKGAGTGTTAKDLTIGAIADANGVFDGDGALVRVSGGKAVQVTRMNTDDNRGDLIVEVGATVEGDGSILLDASKRIQLDGGVKFAKDATLAFSSGHVALGSPDSNVTDGLWLQKAQLDKFVDAGSLYLKSRSTIDVFGDLTFGNEKFDLTLQSAGIVGYQNVGKTAAITTRTLTIHNDDNVSFTAAMPLANTTTPDLGTGKLNMNAETVVNGNNTVRLAGFDQVDITASKEVVVQGNVVRDSDKIPPNKLVADNNLTLNTPRITASNKADYAIESTNGLLKLQGTVGTQPDLSLATSRGTQLKLSGHQVLLAGGTTQASNTLDRHAAAIDMLGGQVILEATGLDATDNVTLGNGARISAQGSAYVLKDQTLALPAGTVTLTARSGDVDVQQGALIDLSASGTGDAGKFVVSALNGEARLAGNIKAAEVGAKGNNATASVDAKIISDISQTIAALTTFSGVQSFRVREGDVIIAAADTITAADVKVVADSGAITVNGKIDASGDKGGSIEIFAKNDVTINSGAQLLAKGLADTTSTAGSLGNGGTVVISSDTGIVSTATPDVNGLSGTLIDVSGDQAGTVKGEGGEVIFRAARTGSGVGNGVNVDVKAAAAVTGAKNVLVEAVKKYSYSTIGTTQQNTISTDTNAFATNVAGLMATYSQTRDGKTAIIAPGIEVRSSGDMTISADWKLGYSVNDTGFIPSGGILTLIAGNDLKVNGSINSEQFSVLDPVFSSVGKLLTPRSSTWSYRLIAGTDTSSVNPEDVIQGAGNITLANSKVVRTGTGFIHVVAGNDIKLGTETGAGAAIYTEGLPEAVTVKQEMNTPANFTLFTENNFGTSVNNSTSNKEAYSDGGGDVKIKAGGNITGSALKANSQNVSSWLYHGIIVQDLKNLSSNPQARWWSNFDKFSNGIGTLGGGDVLIQSGGNVSDLQVVAATNGRMGGDVNQAPSIDNFIELGGGDVSLQANGSATKILLYAGNGDIVAKAGSDLTAELALMSSKAELYATGNLTVSNVTNPTATLNANVISNSGKNQVKFYTYDDQTSISAVSLAGNVNVNGDANFETNPYPSKLLVAAPTGNIYVKDVVLYPSETGNATLLAGHNVTVNNLIISEVNPDSLPLITTKYLHNETSQNLSNYQGRSGHTEGLLHKDDVDPVRIYAQHDVIFTPQAPLVSPKRVEVNAGNDVVDANLVIQNLKTEDVSVIQAGNDIRYSDSEINSDGLLSIEAGVQIAGPGRLHLIAGGNIDLGTSNGIRSVGNVYNPYLTDQAEQGADIMVQPGGAVVADYNGMLNAYVAPSSQYSGIYLVELALFMKTRTGITREKALEDFLKLDAQAQDLKKNQALADFKSLLDRQSQAAFINQVFFAELKAGGRDAINATSATFGDYSRSELAILRMFPTFTINQNLVSQAGSIMKDFGDIANEQVMHSGDLNLFYSQIRSERGGRIEMLVPYGLVNAGLAVAGKLNKPDAELGIVSLRGGDLLAVVRSDFQVNQSRVFTLGGSDLMLYSALADIDAGKGAKTSSSTPPPALRLVNGQVTYDYSGAVTGSGIAALTATGGEPGTVDLFAPYGEINAGEAGIRSAGNINLGAARVIGADNIKAGGVTTGAPVASVAGVSVTAPASSNSSSQGKQGDQVDDAAKQASNNKLNAIPSMISVEILSVGDDSSVPAKSCSDRKDCQI